MSAAPQFQSHASGPHRQIVPHTTLERLRLIRNMIAMESEAIQAASQRVDQSAVTAAELTADCQGNVVVTGVGKAGLVGQKLVATLASTGTPAHFLHPTEAIHGDFGRVGQRDLVWAISNSGRSEEVVKIAAQLRRQSSALVSFTADEENPLAQAATCSVVYGRHAEACPLGLAPTSSTAVMMAVGDAVALLASQLREFSAREFANFHPGGALGRKLTCARDLMRPLDSCRVSHQDITIRECMVASSISGRRSGAVLLVDDEGTLVGIFTDSDLARLLESRREGALDSPICSHMTVDPHCIATETLLSDAVSLLSQHRISELPVVDEKGKPKGILDITDLIALGEIAPPAHSNQRTKLAFSSEI